MCGANGVFSLRVRYNDAAGCGLRLRGHLSMYELSLSLKCTASNWMSPLALFIMILRLHVLVGIREQRLVLIRTASAKVKPLFVLRTERKDWNRRNQQYTLHVA